MQVLAASDTIIDAYLWVGILCAVIVLFWMAWLLTRRWYFRSTDLESQSAWSLQDLRELKADGKIDDMEYDRLREQLIAQHKDTEAEHTEHT